MKMTPDHLHLTFFFNPQRIVIIAVVVYSKLLHVVCVFQTVYVWQFVNACTLHFVCTTHYPSN